MTHECNQLGFDALLADTDATNRANAFAKETAHLPDTMEDGIAYHLEQINAHHTAMLECDFDKALGIREEAHLLASKLNGGRFGIIANEDAPGCVLARECAAHAGVPSWGQDGTFTLEVNGIQFIADMQGMFGIGSTSMTYLGFSVRILDFDKLFISQTGYRSFLGCSVKPEKGMTTDGFVKRLIEHFITDDLKGKLVAIEPRFIKGSKDLQAS